MDEFVFKLPDLGEGVVEGEIVEWHVAVGHVVAEDGPLVDVMTDKATVSISSVVSGTVVRLSGRVGETIAVGSELARIDTKALAQTSSIKIAHGTQKSSATQSPVSQSSVSQSSVSQSSVSRAPVSRANDAHRVGNGSMASIHTGTGAARAPAISAGAAASVNSEVEALAVQISATVPKPLASPAVRRRAREKGLDLQEIVGTGRNGQITDSDLELCQRRTETPLKDSFQSEAGRGDAPLSDSPLSDAPLGIASLGKAPLNEAPNNELPPGSASTTGPLEVGTSEFPLTALLEFSPLNRPSA